jgi:hypothetical protein
MGVCSLNLYTQLYVCKYMYQQSKYLYCSIQHLTLRSKSHEGHCGMWHTALWSCSHIPNKYYLKNNYLTLKSKSHKGHYGTQHTTLWSCTHIPNIVDLSRNTKMLWPGQENTILKTIIWHWGQRSRSHKGHYGMRHTALWSSTHIPNIIDLSRKRKMLWPGQENTI